jgi:3-oxoadipate enol-lactonase
MPFALAGDGARIHYRVAGQRGPWVVLLQGLGLSGRFWFKVPGLLCSGSPRPFRALVVDNRGTGFSDAPRRPWSMARMAEDARAVLDAAGVGRAVVVGTSMGGMIAQHLALRRPERVQGLVLLATSPGLPYGRPPGPAIIKRLVGLRFIDQSRVGSELAGLLLPPSAQPRAAEILAGWPEALKEEAADSRSFLYHVAAVASHSTGRRLGRIRCPTLALTGDQDAVMHPSNSHILAARIPNATCQVLEEVGHDIVGLAPEAIVQGIARVCG